MIKRSVFIQQRYEGDCAIAALAMFLSKTYEQIEDQIQLKQWRKLPITDGYGSIEIAHLLKSFGHDPIITHFVVDDLRQLLLVPSAEFTTSFKYHLIYKDSDSNIWDPAMNTGVRHYRSSDFDNHSPSVLGIICRDGIKDHWISGMPSHMYNEFNFDFIEEYLSKQSQEVTA